MCSGSAMGVVGKSGREGCAGLGWRGRGWGGGARLGGRGLVLVQGAQGGVHGAGEGGGVATQAGDGVVRDVRLGGAAEIVHDRVMGGDGLGGEHGGERVGRLQREQGEAGGVAAGGAGLVGVVGARGDRFEDGVEQVVEEGRVEGGRGGVEVGGDGEGHVCAVPRRGVVEVEYSMEIGILSTCRNWCLNR